MKEGGYLVQWTPTQRVRKGMKMVFPYIVGIGKTTIGSDRPIPFDAHIIIERLSRSSTREYLARGGYVPEELAFMVKQAPVWRWERATSQPVSIHEVNTDLRPRDEYALGFDW